jgi:hypothetical protein
MRLAVLILNYIVVALMALAFIGLAMPAEGTDPTMTILSLVIFTPPAILSLVYAHSNRPKK